MQVYTMDSFRRSILERNVVKATFLEAEEEEGPEKDVDFIPLSKEEKMRLYIRHGCNQ